MSSPDAGAALQPGDVLYVPHRKRLSHAYATGDAGTTELRIYYGHKEVCFDEPRLLPFGDQLVQQSSFTAQAATAWGPGYAWDEVRDLLETLLAEGIIRRGAATEAPATGLVPSQVPPSSCPEPRAWSGATCEAITRDLGGRPVEIGYLEAVIPAYRIAHPALDGDGRQVGEANVFPPGLRLDHDTEWRVCHYPGSRYHDDAPMNVTALKAMIKHWKPMMAVVLEARAELRNRLARSRGGWTVGDLHTFARVVLALPAFPLMSGGAPPAPPPVHPVLSSVFRVTDGIRMTTHDMLFLSAERTRRPDEPITADELYGFTERNGLFLSGFGVCAGPKAMIDQFFAVVFDGARPDGTDGTDGTDGYDHAPEVRALLSQLPAAVDYGLLGLQVWGVSRSVWTATSRAYAELRDLFDDAYGGAGVCARLRERLAGDWREIERERLAIAGERDVHQVVYADAYEQAWRGLRAPIGPPTLAERIAIGPEGPAHRSAASRLRSVLAARLGDARLGDAPLGDAPLGDAPLGDAPLADRMADLLLRYLREEQAILAAVTELQAAINALLDRPRPERPLTVRDFHITFAMHGGIAAGFPYLLDMLEHELGFRVECTADTIEVVDHTRYAGNPAGGQ